MRVPIFELPPLSQPTLSFEDWVVQTAHVQWGRGGAWGVDCEMERQSWSNLDRYWHHYAMSKLGDAANQFIKDAPSVETVGHDTCIYLNESTDTFLLSQPISDRDNADEIVSWPPSCAQLVVREPAPDLCAYQMILERKADILGKTSLREHEIPRRCISLPLPMAVRRNIRRVMFADVQDDGLEPYVDPETRFGTGLARFPEIVSQGPLTQDEAASAWKADHFPQIRRVLGQPQPQLLYLEVFASQSRTLVGKMETETAKCLEIAEVDVEEVTDDDN